MDKIHRRMNDFIWYKVCKRCGIRVTWQHEERSENTLENFHTALKEAGWRKSIFSSKWTCNIHNKKTMRRS